MFDRYPAIPLPACDTYTQDDEEVEQLWSGVQYLNDDGDIINLVIYLDDTNSLKAIEESIFFGTYQRVPDPTPELFG